MAYIGTIYLFGFIPIKSGLYSTFIENNGGWRLRPWIAWACTIRFKEKSRQHETVTK